MCTVHFFPLRTDTHTRAHFIFCSSAGQTHTRAHFIFCPLARQTYTCTLYFLLFGRTHSHVCTFLFFLRPDRHTRAHFIFSLLDTRAVFHFVLQHSCSPIMLPCTTFFSLFLTVHTVYEKQQACKGMLVTSWPKVTGSAKNQKFQINNF